MAQDWQKEILEQVLYELLDQDSPDDILQQKRLKVLLKALYENSQTKRKLQK